VVGATVTARFLPATGGWARRGQPPIGSLRLVLRDRPFVFLLVSTLLGFFVYCGFETVLPVVAVSSYGLSASSWGLLVVISPLLVVLFQLRLTRLASRIPVALRLASALLIMSLPFLALVASAQVAVIAAVIVGFDVGEMLWMPTSQAVAAQLAPARMRGSYFGVLSAMTGPAWTLAPLIALQMRAHIGLSSVWILFAAIGLAAAAAGVVAIRSVDSRPFVRVHEPDFPTECCCALRRVTRLVGEVVTLRTPMARSKPARLRPLRLITYHHGAGLHNPRSV
jgi:MFS family permease